MVLQAVAVGAQEQVAQILFFLPSHQLAAVAQVETSLRVLVGMVVQVEVQVVTYLLLGTAIPLQFLQAKEITVVLVLELQTRPVAVAAQVRQELVRLPLHKHLEMVVLELRHQYLVRL
jgi:hypothetical protein